MESLDRKYRRDSFAYALTLVNIAPRKENSHGYVFIL